MPAPEPPRRPPALGDVDELCRLVLVAGRLGCRVRLEGASDELRGALVLAGVDDLLVHDGDRAPEVGTSQPTGPRRDPTGRPR